METCKTCGYGFAYRNCYNCEELFKICGCAYGRVICNDCKEKQKSQGDDDGVHETVCD